MAPVSLNKIVLAAALVLTAGAASAGGHIFSMPRADGSSGSMPDWQCGRVFGSLSRQERELDENAIVTATGSIYPVEDFPTVLEEALEEVERSDYYDSLLIFVHGRGKHPGKLFRTNLICGLEYAYRAKVIAFHWPSWTWVFGIAGPERDARAAADDFLDIVAEVGQQKKRMSGNNNRPGLILLTHSMGSFVVEQAGLNSPDPSLAGIFDTMVINAPASLAPDHVDWIDRQIYAGKVFVTVNNNDFILKRYRNFTRKPLGLIGCEDGFPQSPEVTYVNFSDYEVMHRYFLPSGRPINRPVNRFFKTVLGGDLPPPESTRTFQC